MSAMAPAARILIVNGAALTSGAATLADLIASGDWGTRKVATAVNGNFVPERARAATALASGDRIEILTARQGG